MFKKAYKLSLLCIYTLFFFSTYVQALSVNDLEYKNSYVNDFANIISSDKESELNNIIYNHFASTTNQIAIVTVPDMSGDYIENFAFRLYEKWGIGNKEKDNGVLFLISLNDRKVRIEVGYGLEPVLTDSKTKKILDTVVTPEFKNNNYEIGIEKGLDGIINVLNSEDTNEFSPQESNSRFNLKFILNVLYNIFPIIFVFGLIFLQWIMAILARTKSWWLGGAIGGLLGGMLMFFGGLTVLLEIVTAAFVLLGLILDYFVSKNYKKHKIGNKSGPPEWWSGGTWGPGGKSSSWSSSDTFGGFGGGMSGGGGSTSSW
jgi:uncharacterized protein